MNFLIDEDVPVKLLKALATSGHNVIRVGASTKDREIANQAISQNRILITLDKDFTNKLLYPPSSLNIIHIRIHPPFADDLIVAVEQLLQTVSEKELKGLIILQKDGHWHITQ